MKKYRLALLGCGFLNNIVAQQVKDEGALSAFELVGVLGRDADKSKTFAQCYQIHCCHNLDDLIALKPDFIAEAASVASIHNYGEYIVEAGINLVVLSIGAFADQDLYHRIEAKAKDAGSRVYLASGAVGGFDILRTSALMGPIEVKMKAQKSAQSLTHTPLYQSGLELAREVTPVFEGTTAQAIELLPTHVNVAVATALASAGPQATQMKIEVVPDFQGDNYKVEVLGEEVKLELNMYSKTSSIAAWSVIAVLRNAIASIVF